jgi:hypothetical protein
LSNHHHHLILHLLCKMKISSLNEPLSSCKTPNPGWWITFFLILRRHYDEHRMFKFSLCFSFQKPCSHQNKYIFNTLIPTFAATMPSFNQMSC